MTSGQRPFLIGQKIHVGDQSDYCYITFNFFICVVGIPDETFFASLAHNAHLEVPGAYRGKYIAIKAENISFSVKNDPKLSYYLTRQCIGWQ